MRSEELANALRQREGVINDAARTRAFLDRKIERLERELTEARRAADEFGGALADLTEERRRMPEMAYVESKWWKEFGDVVDAIVYSETPVDPAEALAQITDAWKKGDVDLAPFQDLTA